MDLGTESVKSGRTQRLVAQVDERSGAALDLKCKAGNSVSTDARAAYMDFQGSPLRRAQLVQGTCLKIGAETVFQQADRGDWETE